MAYMTTHGSESCIERGLRAPTCMAGHGLESYLFVKDGGRQRCILPATDQRAAFILIEDRRGQQQRLWLAADWKAASIEDVYKR